MIVIKVRFGIGGRPPARGRSARNQRLPPDPLALVNLDEAAA
jgi:hypothetical protein